MKEFLFMKTKLGFLLFAVGDNEQMVTTLGVNNDNIKKSSATKKNTKKHLKKVLKKF